MTSANASSCQFRLTSRDSHLSGQILIHLDSYDNASLEKKSDVYSGRLASNINRASVGFEKYGVKWRLSQPTLNSFCAT